MTINEQLTKDVCMVIAESLDLNYASVRPETIFVDLDMDSLAIIELVLALEEQFEIVIEDEEVDAFHRAQPPKTVADLVQALGGRIMGMEHEPGAEN